MHTAASAGDDEALKELLDGGADVNAKDGTDNRTSPPASSSNASETQCRGDRSPS